MTGRKARYKISLPVVSPKAWVACAIFAGLIWGNLRPVFLSLEDLNALLFNLRQFAAYFDTAQIGLEDLWAGIFRHGYILVLIWLCAAVPKIFWASYLLLYLRSMTLAFSISLMLRAFGTRGVLMAFALNLPQNILMLVVCSYTICFIAQTKANRAKAIKVIILGIVGVLAASFYEVFITPYLFAMTL
jgi:hypothetical protein